MVQLDQSMAWVKFILLSAEVAQAERNNASSRLSCSGRFGLVALLFVADATLESGSPPIVTSTRVGLPEPWHPNTAGALTTTPAPAPDMSSKAVLAAAAV